MLETQYIWELILYGMEKLFACRKKVSYMTQTDKNCIFLTCVLAWNFIVYYFLFIQQCNVYFSRKRDWSSYLINYKTMVLKWHVKWSAIQHANALAGTANIEFSEKLIWRTTDYSVDVFNELTTQPKIYLIGALTNRSALDRIIRDNNIASIDIREIIHNDAGMIELYDSYLKSCHMITDRMILYKSFILYIA